MANLRQLRQRGPLKQPGDLLEQMLNALAARHRQGEVHGGLCPEAIDVAADGHLTLRSTGRDADFRAPELEKGHAPAMAQDVYAAGAVAWFMLTGSDPSRPPRPLHGYGWLDALVAELTAPLERRPLNAEDALKRLQALRPRPTNRAPFVLAAAMALAGIVLFVTAPEDDEPTPQPEVLQPMAPESVRCKDAKAEGPHLEAAQAWQTCRFATAHQLYVDHPDASPSVLACRTERMAATQPHLSTFEKVEGDLDRGTCHWARLKLEALDFTVNQGCLTTLELCEEQELPIRQAEVAMSEAKLKAQLSNPLVTDVTFRPLSDPWTWDIVVEGNWVAFFDQLESLKTSGDPKDANLAGGMLGYFTALCATIGYESANTMWTSRDIVFQDRQCVHRLPTADARKVARRLEDAVESSDQGALILAVQYVFSRLKDC